MNLSFRVTGLIALTLFALLGGCEKSDRVSFSTEDMDPNYSRAKQLGRQGRNQEALLAFLKVIATRGDNAPESHLEAAVIYQQHIKDPIAAIYHYRKYLELQGNTKQAELVRPRIEAAKREFARTLPANPLDDASVKLGYLDQLDRLQRENDQLKMEIAALRAGLPGTAAGPATTQRGGIDFNTPPPATNAPLPRPVPVDSLPTADPRPTLGASTAAAEPQPRPAADSAGGAAGRRIAASPSIELGQQRQNPPTQRPAAASTTQQPQQQAQQAGKKHTVQAGDTLYNLSQRYYGSRARWREILQANRDQLKGENDRLRVGMELRIP